MEEILLQLLHEIATSRDLMSVCLAAGVAHERLLALGEEDDTNTEEMQETPQVAA